MRCLRTAVALVLALSPLLCVADSAPKEDWLPVTPQDLQYKEVPNNPGVTAVQLYYANYINDIDHREFYYFRIKILKEDGMKYADVEIPFIPGFLSVKDLKARTIHPDGTIVDFTGDTLEKTIVKTRGIKFLARTFTFPSVTVGSIVEYKYRLQRDYLTNNSWEVQHDLFTVKEKFFIQAAESRLALLYVTTFLNNAKPEHKGRTLTLEMENVPAFQSEPFMPPESTYKSQVRFFYGLSDTMEDFWKKYGEEANRELEWFIGNHGEIKSTAAKALGSEADPLKKLRLLYDNAQQIRNLTYERSREEVEQRKEGIKENENVVDVLKRGYGTRNDITRLFVALARAAGFPAYVVEVSDRKERFFDKAVLSGSQLDSELALVNVNGKDVYLDPGTRFCPFGLIRWTQTSVTALKLDPKGPGFVQVPSSGPPDAVTVRSARAALAPDGSLKGTINVEYKGQEALQQRLDAIDQDEEGRKKSLEDEIKRWLASGAVVKLHDVQGWEAKDSSLIVNFDISIPGYASVVGKRLLMPIFLFQSPQRDAFKFSERKYPVYFPYAYGELDKVGITIPGGFSLEAVPSRQQFKLPYAAYESASAVQGNQFISNRVLYLAGIFFEVSRYGELKDFFGKVQGADEGQASFRLETTATAQPN